MVYKDALPNDTVRRIKVILDRLGIQTKEALYDMNGLCFSCRVSIASHGLEALDKGTNGKGMTPEYSLASGYAELMERLQNKFLVNEAMRHAGKLRDTKPLPFRFFPDESIQQTDVKDYLGKIRSLFPNYNLSEIERFCETVAKNYDNKHQIEWLGVPFVRFSKQENDNGIEYVPIILARANSSTGLCAGNTPHEAILQGINEIFERYVLQRIYLDNITPPSVPLDYLKDSCVAKRLDSLKADGYLYDVKDLSLGRGFPVVGLILTNTKNGTTMFRLGADLSQEIALERCLTEIYQGRTEEDARFLDYPLHSSIDIENNSEIRNREYQKSLKDGTGYFPKSIFAGTPTYSFSSPVLYRSGDSKTDFRNVLQFLHERGYTLFVRDNSFLHFPAYQIMIPSLSDQDCRLRDIFTEYFTPFDLDMENNTGVSRERDAAQWLLYDIKGQKDVREFIGKHYSNDDSLRLAPYNTAPQNVINKHLLLFLTAVKNEDYLDANNHFARFMQQREEQGFPYDDYLACVGRYIYCQAYMPNDDMVTLLHHFHREETVSEVMSDFSNPEVIMKNYSFPTCFDCNRCPLISTCHYRDAVNFERMMQQAQQANPIDQNKLFQLLNP